MKIICFVPLLFFSGISIAQTYIGVKFEKNLTWNSIKERSKKENKYIFLDAYTTWCGPCKYMAAKIFTQKLVGTFINKNFISVAVQMDSTKKDNQEIRDWYKDARLIASEYKIDAFPTFLFFNSGGILVHYIIGASANSNAFLMKVKKALDPKTQILNLKNEFARGNRDSVFLRSLIVAAKEVNDDSLANFINSYLATQKDLTTRENIQFIMKATKSENDIGFNILSGHSRVVESIIGKQERKKLLTNIIFNDEIYPLLSRDSKISNVGIMTIYNTDSLNDNVDWQNIEDEVSKKYDTLGKYIVLYAKLRFYEWKNDWDNLNSCLLNYTLTENKDEIDLDLINKIASEFLNYCSEKKYYENASKWSASLLNGNNPYFLQTYSRLLYKGGKTTLAIQYMQKCSSLLRQSDPFVNETLIKMKAGKEID
jgi:thioredoxin-related protein